MREEADKLLRAAEQVRLMEYEVGLKLYERVKRGAKLAQTEKEMPLTSAQVCTSSSTASTGTTSSAATG